MAEFVQSERRKNKLVHENFVYVFSKRTQDEQHGIWVCEKRSVCKGRIWTLGLDGPVVKISTQHNHAAQAARPRALQVIQEIRYRAETTHEQPQQIVAIAVQEIHANVAAALPRKDTMKRMIRNVRNNNGAPNLPQSLEELEVPQEYQQIMVNGNVEQFLLYDSVREILPRRIILFSTQQNLHLLSQSRQWFADGTFSTAPHLFQQLYTLHVVQFNSVIPVIYALLPDKTRATYVKLLQEIKNLQPGLHPQLLMTDFELAAMQAFDIEFPGVSKTGCFFHLTQNVWRKVQNEGLQEQYQNDHEFARWIRMIPALAFVPPQDVVQAFEELTNDDHFPQEALVVANYFEDSYIGRQQRHRRQQPMFPIDLWNVHERTLQNQQRTNNDVEGWHRSFQSTCSTYFPHIFRLIDSLKRQQGLHNLDIAQLIAGAPRIPNKKYAAIAARIRTIVQDYGNRNNVDYLRGIAYNFEF